MVTRAPDQRNILKQTLLKVLMMPALTESLAYLTKTRVSIFMMHRFSVPDLGISGHDPADLRRNLAHLRKERFELLPVQEVFRRLRDGEPVNRAVAFTIDDGYFDHAEVAVPIFQEFDCPVTCFVSTGFLDGKNWFWWDKLTTIFDGAKRPELHAKIGATTHTYRWTNPAERRQACFNLNVRCQDASEEDRLACIGGLSRQAEVDLPATPPPRFAPMTWDQARRLESHGVSFGPHTVTHPVLGTTSTEQADWEIAESWARLKTEVQRPVPIFCYPNGRSQDVGEREVARVKELGLWGGLMAHPGRLDPAAFRTSPNLPYRVPRFSYENPLSDLLQCVSGLEHIKADLRSRRQHV